MIIVEQIAEVREKVAAARKQGKSIALVPTMGYLHQGHLSLVQNAKTDNAFVVMSIFVNPLQFGPQEDYGSYPRDLEKDARLAQEAGVDLIFHPSVEEMYPEKVLSYVEVGELDQVLCGKSRPGHFRGVTTVVSKLFNIVQADYAYFGQKDYQQYLVISRMVKDLNFPVKVVRVPIVREADGLALSSRNVYLSPEQRAEAVVLSKSLTEAEKRITEGERDSAALIKMIRKKITTESSGQIDYVEIRAAEDLSPVDIIDQNIVIALAVRFGKTRLIDNKLVEVK